MVHVCVYFYSIAPDRPGDEEEKTGKGKSEKKKENTEEELPNKKDEN